MTGLRRRGWLLLALAAALGACRRSQEGAAAPERAPSLALQDLGGKTVRLSDFQGKVVLLDFWATYCEPCHESIPMFEKLYDELKPRGLEVVGVSMDPAPEEVPPYVRENRMRYTVLLDPQTTSQDSFGVRGLPTTMLIDRQGRIRRRWLGFDEGVAAEVRAGIEDALREPAS
ncbi:MAG TPA: TlpA disulfide reductase family protein [Elusimicrobiota bacterium]|jgi:peroxiredoxin|nr:TlpA disulfide reductase family protein [Elusimicrobiota bacterium]